MKCVVTGVKVEGAHVSFEQRNALANALCTQNIINNGSLKIHCRIRKQPFNVRNIVREILECSYSQIYIEYHEKD
jgi:hypothetical protein